MASSETLVGLDTHTKPTAPSSLALAGRMLRRDWRSGELRILVAALVIAVAAVTAINLVTDRFGRLLQRESAELVGGDLVVQSTRTPDAAWLQQGLSTGLRTAQVVEFSSVVLFGDELLLTSNKAVSNAYPLYGQLRSSAELYGDETTSTQGPAAGNVWVDARVLGRLGAKVGDQLTIGASEFTITRVLTYEPDRSGNIFNLAPRVMLNLEDLGAAEVLGPGSRVSYRYLFASGGTDGDVEAFATLLQPKLGPGHQLVSAQSGDGQSSSAMARAEQFLGLTALLAILLAAIAIAMAVRRYSERHYDVSGMLRCLGVQQRQLMTLYGWQLTLLAALAVVLGTIVGWLVHMGLLAAIANLLPPHLPAAGVGPYLTGAVTAVLLMMGVALPPLLRLKSVPPLRVFRRELAPIPVSGWLVYGLAIVAFAGLMLLLFDDVGTLLMILLAACLAIGLVGAALYGAFMALRKLPMRGNLLLRSLRNLASHATTSTGQLLSFGLTAMVMALLLLLRTDLIQTWQAQLPEDAPNNFAFNIQPYEKARFESTLTEAGIAVDLSPVTRGRLVAVGGEPPPKFEGQGGQGRELNFTWAEQLPATNELVAGQWHSRASGSEAPLPEVSMEEQLAERLGVELGETITVNIAGSELTATVTSLRTVDWESFAPNFYMIFSPGALAQFPTSYLTSFHLDDSQKPLLNQLARDFPSISVIEVDALIEQVDKIIGQVTLMVEMMLLFVLLAGVTVLLASIHTSLDERLREGALMRAIGASRRYLRAAAVSEFALLGLLAGLLACAGVEIACSAIYQRVFDLPYQTSLLLWVLLPLVLAVGVGAAGYLSTRKVLEVSPRQLLS